MEALFFFSLFLLPVITPPRLIAPRTHARNLDCDQITVEDARRTAPGEVAAPKPRGDYVDRTVIRCRGRMLEEGLRPPDADALLQKLDGTAARLAEGARVAGEGAGLTWHVEVDGAPEQVGPKVSFAVKNALVERGLRVSDRAPSLAAGDIDVLTRMQPEDAFPLACGRYFAEGSLGAGDALLGVVALDPRDTTLHAGLCVQGRWTWLP